MEHEHNQGSSSTKVRRRKRRPDSPTAAVKIGPNSKKPCLERSTDLLTSSLGEFSVCASTSSQINKTCNKIVEEEEEDDDIQFIEIVPYKKEEEENGVIVLDSDSDEDDDKSLEKDEIERFLSCTTSKEVMELLNKNQETVEYHEWVEYRKATAQKQKIIQQNKILRENLNREIGWRQDSKVPQSQSIRLYEHLGHFRREEKRKKKIKETNKQRPNDKNVPLEMRKACQDILENEMKAGRYVPPRTRTRIMRNISLDPKNKIPVYCDIPRTIGEGGEEMTEEQLKQIKKATALPETLSFEFITTNMLPKKKPLALEDAIQESRKKKNRLNCGCAPDPAGNMTKCSENPDCLCFKMNEKLKERQKFSLYRQEHTNFSTFGKIWMRDLDHFYDSIAFSCSNDCGCEGKCDNNVLYSIEEHVNSFEVYRHDEKGFGLRTTSYIPAGVPVVEFVGVIADFSYVDRKESEDYAFALTYKNDLEFFGWLESNEDLSLEMRTHLAKVWSESAWFIDPKKKGNEGRFVTHGCHPNMAMVRVFQKGFLPTQCRCVLVSLEDIWPGTQLCFDYGSNYINNHLDGKCLCNTLGCVKRPETLETLVNVPWRMIYQYYLDNYNRKKRKYKLYMEEKEDINEEKERVREQETKEWHDYLDDFEKVNGIPPSSGDNGKCKHHSIFNEDEAVERDSYHSLVNTKNSSYMNLPDEKVQHVEAEVELLETFKEEEPDFFT